MEEKVKVKRKLYMHAAVDFCERVIESGKGVDVTLFLSPDGEGVQLVLGHESHDVLRETIGGLELGDFTKWSARQGGEVDPGWADISLCPTVELVS